MKLSELVSYRMLLEELTPVDKYSCVDSVLEPITNAIDQSAMVPIQFKTDIKNKVFQVKNSLMDFSKSLDEVKKHVNQMIESLEPIQLQRSYQLYDQGLASDSTDLILNRRFVLDEKNSKFVESRIKIYSNWKFPGLIIRPGLETWIDSMVALDPLYIVDSRYDLLEPAIQRFNHQYQDRLRCYTATDNLDHCMLIRVPDHQIGVVLAYNFFHYKPFEIVRAYLTEIYNKLRPGGVMLFTFNDCDRWGGVANAERFYMCYTPGRMVKSLLKNLGFEIITSHIIDNAVTWMEIKKPGELASLRGGQALAKVVAKVQ